MRLAIHGATGRMGLAVARMAASDPDIELVGAACSSSDAALGRDIGELAGVGTLGVATSADIQASLLGADVVIDFSVAPAVGELMMHAVRLGVGVVCGTTNLDAATQASLTGFAETIPVMWAPNMSIGVQVLAEVVESALRKLGPDYDVEIVELHHRKKVDAPSGTAKRLARAAQQARPELKMECHREGNVGPRSSDEMGVFAVRGGDIVGDHTVYLVGPAERLELTHRASSRDLFAHGAVRAAKALVGKPPRLYTLQDVLSA